MKAPGCQRQNQAIWSSHVSKSVTPPRHHLGAPIVEAEVREGNRHSWLNLSQWGSWEAALLGLRNGTALSFWAIM